MVDHSMRVARTAQATFRNLGDELGGIVLHLETAAYYRVNLVGAAIWELLDGEPTFGALVTELRSRIDDEPESLEEDASEFLQALVSRDLAHVWPDDDQR